MNDFFDKKNYTEKDIYDLIANGIEESMSLEFKHEGATEKKEEKRQEMAKDVSSFANSSGGIIIYGIEEKNNRASALSFIDGNIFTKEALDQIIASRIHRRIQNIEIYPIRFAGDLKKTVYVVKIPESLFAPHMVGNCYYKRQNFTTVKMEEYEVRNSYYRSQKTVLTIDPLGFSTIRDSWNFTNFHIRNEGNVMERFFKIEISIPQIAYIEFPYEANHLINMEKYRRYASEEDDVYVVVNNEPVFPGESVKVCTIAWQNLQLSNDKNITEKFRIKVKLYYTGGLEEKEFSYSAMKEN